MGESSKALADEHEVAHTAPTLKIKSEKFDPEIEQKIKSITTVQIKREKIDDAPNSSDNNVTTEDEQPDSESNSNDTQTTTEDKKSIQPVKSSNEILTELFKVFNAAPPEQLLDDKNLLKKSHHKSKKVKKEKKKKRKKTKSDGEAVETDSDGSDSDKDKIKKHKHKKKKKHKHKEEKGKEKARDKDKDKVPARSKEKVKLKEKHSSIKEKPYEQRVREKSKDRERRKTSSPVLTNEDTDEHRRVDGKRHIEANTENVAAVAKVSRSSERSRERGHNSFYNGFRERDNHRHHNQHESLEGHVKIKAEPVDIQHNSHEHTDREHDGHISEISLSDEETYLKERERVGNRRRNDNESSQKRPHNAFYISTARSRSKSRDWDRDRDYRDRSRYDGNARHRRRSRSRSHSPHDLGIDKKRLLEIARKNAISMFKRGNLPGCAEMTEELKDKVLLKMRYGGRTVQDLTDFCKKISNGENLSDLSSDEASDVDKGGNAKAFHHPFLLKEREPIVMHIRNATPIAPRKTEEQAKAITMQFPVSSGQQHRITEAWVPVESKEGLAPLPALPAATQSTTIFKAAVGATPIVASGAKGAPKNVFDKPISAETKQEPAFKPMGVPLPANEESGTAKSITIPTVSTAVPNANNAVVPIVAKQITTNFVPAVAPPNVVTNYFVADVPIPSTASAYNNASFSNTVFPQTNGPTLDVSSIISKRLNAMRRLQENPMDSEAIKMMYNSQKEMTSWASSKHLPGQFTGSTGVNVLRARELNSGPQMWARRDQLTSTQPVTGGMGMHLLQKMGWKPGEGLGREKTGSLQPLLLDVKLDKRGLVAKDDNNQQQKRNLLPHAKKQRNTNVEQAQQNLQDKHPVCLLNELTSKRKWTPPLYTLVNEVGPSHSKMFLFSVSINGQTFTPNQASNTKKEAKLIAARYCLQSMGILPAQ